MNVQPIVVEVHPADLLEIEAQVSVISPDQVIYLEGLNAEAVEAANRSEAWAVTQEDIEVEPGLYSSFHHAVKSAASSVAANDSQTASATSESAASASAEQSRISQESSKDSAEDSAASAAEAKASEDAARVSERAAEGYSETAQESMVESANSEAAAHQSEQNSKASEQASAGSATEAAQSQEAAKQSEVASAQSSSASAESAAQSLESQNAAANSQSAAAESEQNSQASETAAAQSANSASQSESASDQHRIAAATSAAESAESQAAAKDSETESASSQSASAESELSAASSASQALQSEQSAAVSESLARLWAQEEKDVPVEASEYSAYHWSKVAEQFAGTLTNGMYFAGSWDLIDGLPPEPETGAVPWYRIVSTEVSQDTMYSLDLETIASEATPGDQIFWDPESLEWVLIDSTDKVWSVNGKIGDVDLDAEDVGAQPTNHPEFTGSLDLTSNSAAVLRMIDVGDAPSVDWNLVVDGSSFSIRKNGTGGGNYPLRFFQDNENAQIYGHNIHHTGNPPTATEIGALPAEGASIPSLSTNLGYTDLDDLNSFSHAGFYHQHASSNATPERNYPSKYAGSLEVIYSGANGNRVTQKYTTYFTTGPEEYVRSNGTTSAEFGDWVQTYSESHKPTADEIGAAPASHSHSNYASSTHDHDDQYSDIDHSHTAAEVGAYSKDESNSRYAASGAPDNVEYSGAHYYFRRIDNLGFEGGDRAPIIRFAGETDNTSFVDIKTIRESEGEHWVSSRMRLQHGVDQTYGPYIDFKDDRIAFGILWGSSYASTIDDVLTIKNNRVEVEGLLHTTKGVLPYYDLPSDAYGSASDYPDGLSIGDHTSGTNWPTGYSTAVTFKAIESSTTRMFQLIGNTDSTDLYWRSAHNNPDDLGYWKPFSKIYHELNPPTTLELGAVGRKTGIDPDDLSESVVYESNTGTGGTPTTSRHLGLHIQGTTDSRALQIAAPDNENSDLIYRSKDFSGSGYGDWFTLMRSEGGRETKLKIDTSFGTSYDDHGLTIETSHGSSKMGMDNTSYCHYTTTSSSGHWFNSSILSVGNVEAYSDIRLKENIETIPDALGKLNQLRGVTYDRTDIECLRQTGVIAQEIQQVLPEAVSVADDEIGTLSVAHGNMVGLLIEAIKELNKKVDQLMSERAQ